MSWFAAYALATPFLVFALAIATIRAAEWREGLEGRQAQATADRSAG